MNSDLSFCRKSSNQSFPCTPEEENDIVSKFPLKNIIRVSQVLIIFLTHRNVDFNLIKSANSELKIELSKQSAEYVKTNVAIASAITAIARIEMMKYKTLPGVVVYYSDTDSIIINMELPAHMVGDGIGLMKDELNGGWIEKAYFFVVKKYAFIDHEGNVKTVLSGLPRNSLTWEEVETLANGGSIEKDIPSQFYKFFSTWSIVIKPKKVRITSVQQKTLDGNRYLPIEINEVKNYWYINLKNVFVAKIKYFLGKYNKNVTGKNNQ